MPGFLYQIEQKQKEQQDKIEKEKRKRKRTKKKKAEDESDKPKEPGISKSVERRIAIQMGGVNEVTKVLAVKAPTEIHIRLERLAALAGKSKRRIHLQCVESGLEVLETNADNTDSDIAVKTVPGELAKTVSTRDEPSAQELAALELKDQLVQKLRSPHIFVGLGKDELLVYYTPQAKKRVHLIPHKHRGFYVRQQQVAVDWVPTNTV